MSRRPPPPADEVRAVIDRMVDDQAVVLVGEDEDEHLVPRALLPRDAVEGSHLVVRIVDDGVEVVGIDLESERAQRAAVEERLGRLRRERPPRRFDR